MAKKGITRDRTGLILQTLFNVLIDYPEGIQAKDAIDQVVSRISLTDHEKGEYESGSRRFDKILRFATIDAVKAGWLRKNKGIWSITEEGRESLKTYPDPGDFYREVSKLFHEWRKSQHPKGTDDIEDANQELEAKITFEEAEEQAWQEISGYL